jgi:DinB family protein
MEESKGSPVNRREQLLKRLDKAWRAFQESYAGLSEEDRLEPGVTGNWSVKDIIAHVTVWEEEALKHLPVILEGETPPRYSVVYGGINAFNAQTMKQKQSLSLTEVLRQSDAIHQRLVALLENAPEEQLGGGTRFRHRLRLDTYGHYPNHAEAIRRWRER